MAQEPMKSTIPNPADLIKLGLRAFWKGSALPEGSISRLEITKQPMIEGDLTPNDSEPIVLIEKRLLTLASAVTFK